MAQIGAFFCVVAFGIPLVIIRQILVLISVQVDVLIVDLWNLTAAAADLRLLVKSILASRLKAQTSLVVLLGFSDDPELQ